jgi:DNA invertase Pin-like site-specific DNA recombinase
MLSMLGAFAEFECSLLREHQRDGIAIARQDPEKSRAGRLRRRLSLWPKCARRTQSTPARAARRWLANLGCRGNRYISTWWQTERRIRVIVGVQVFAQ